MNIALDSSITAVEFNGSEVDVVKFNGVEVWRKAAPTPVEPDTWETKTWSGMTAFRGAKIWKDGDAIYYSNTSSTDGVTTGNKVLDKSTSTWSNKTWAGLTNFDGDKVWTDGDNIYYSNSSNQYVLNKATSTWTAKTWTGLTSFNANNICI